MEMKDRFPDYPWFDMQAALNEIHQKQERALDDETNLTYALVAKLWARKHGKD